MSGHGHGSRPIDDDSRITYFAATHTRGKREIFGIRAIDRGKHMYVIGKTGMGKSTMLENMAIQDIQNGEGIAFIDPHGSTAEKLLDFVPHERIKDVLYFAPFDVDYPVGFNVMEDVGYDKRHLVVSGLMGALKRIWVDAWSARMEYILQNTLLALLEYPDTTLLDVNRMLTNKAFRAAVVDVLTDPVVKAFWTEEFANFTDTYTREATPAIQNKIGQFVSNPLIRNIIGQGKSSFDVRAMMDQKKILIVNLSKGRMGETNASLLGSMLVVKIYLAAMSRADEPAVRMAKLPRCYFYVDEFQSMMNDAFADILSESRKYKLALTLANQYIEQMEEKVRDAVFGNIGTLICFRVGPFDAEVLKTVFEPTFLAEDLVGLGIGQIYLTLMIDGAGSPPFSAETIPPIEAPSVSYRDDVIRFSREQFARSRSDVEGIIARRQTEFAPDPKKPPREAGRFGPPRGDQRRSFDGPSSSQPPTPRPPYVPPTAPPQQETPRPPAVPLAPQTAEHAPRPPYAPPSAPPPQATRPPAHPPQSSVEYAPRPQPAYAPRPVPPPPAAQAPAYIPPPVHVARSHVPNPPSQAAPANTERNALRDAIRQASAQRAPLPPQSPRESQRSDMQSPSPLDILRARQGARKMEMNANVHQSPTPKPVTPPFPPTSSPRSVPPQREVERPQSAPAATPREQVVAPRPIRPTEPQSPRNGPQEVSSDVLRQLLHYEEESRS